MKTPCFTEHVLVDRAERIPEVFQKVNEVAQRSLIFRKIFVRGLAFETTTETLNEVFSVHGEMDDCAVAYDKSTGKSKGNDKLD